MNVTVTYKTNAIVDIRPGDKVLLTYRDKKNKGRIIRERRSTIVRLVESNRHTYAVFSRNEWRPVSTYNKTWWKVE